MRRASAYAQRYVESLTGLVRCEEIGGTGSEALIPCDARFVWLEQNARFSLQPFPPPPPPPPSPPPPTPRCFGPRRRRERRASSRAGDGNGNSDGAGASTGARGTGRGPARFAVVDGGGCLGSGALPRGLAVPVERSVPRERVRQRQRNAAPGERDVANRRAAKPCPCPFSGRERRRSACRGGGGGRPGGAHVGAGAHVSR